MNIVLCNHGLVIFGAAIRDTLSWEVGIFTANVPIVPGILLGELNEADYPGYSRREVGYAAGEIVATGLLRNYSEAPVIFEIPASYEPAITGYFVTNPANATECYFAQRFATPIPSEGQVRRLAFFPDWYLGTINWPYVQPGG